MPQVRHRIAFSLHFFVRVNEFACRCAWRCVAAQKVCHYGALVAVVENVFRTSRRPLMTQWMIWQAEIYSRHASRVEWTRGLNRPRPQCAADQYLPAIDPMTRVDMADARSRFGSIHSDTAPMRTPKPQDRSTASAAPQ